MWTPNQSDHAVLLAMPPWRRQFVQHWVELTSSDIGFRWRLRPLSRRLLLGEASRVTSNRQGKRSLNGSTYHASLLDSEWRATPKTVFKAWAAHSVRDDPSKLAHDIAHGLSLAGFTQRSINEVRRVFLDGRALQEQLDSVLTWHQAMTTPRSFTLVLPLARMGTVPGAFGWRRRRLDELPQTFQAVMVEAVLAGHATECDKFLEVTVEAIDANAAVAIFQEQFDRYLLRLPTAASKTRLPTKPIALVGDPAPSVAGRVTRFRLPPRYGYGRPNYLDGAGLSRIVRAASEDVVIELLLDQYLLALDAVSRGSVREAFQALLPVLDVAFDCDCSSYKGMSPFSRSVEIGSLLLAASFPRALFRYLSDYLREGCWINSGRAGVTGAHRDALRVLTKDEVWYTLSSAYQWNETLRERRNEFVRLLASPQPALHRIYTAARWDLARGVRARHHLAHRGEPLSDAYLLAITLEAIWLNLVFRCSAVEEGLGFGQAVQLLHDMLHKNSFPLFPLSTVLHEDDWALARPLVQPPP